MIHNSEHEKRVASPTWLVQIGKDQRFLSSLSVVWFPSFLCIVKKIMEINAQNWNATKLDASPGSPLQNQAFSLMPNSLLH